MAKKKVFQALFILGFVLLRVEFCLAQMNLFNDSVNGSKPFSLSILGNVTAKSNAFPNHFYTTFYQGGYLTDETKRKAADKLQELNRFGADADFNLLFRYSPDTLLGKTGWSYTMRVAERRHLNLEMTGDFFNMGFFGNAMFENKIAKLAAFQLDFISYQQIGLGLEKKLKLNDNLHQWGVMANFLNGRNAQRAILNQADLFTATDGAFIELDINGSYNRTDSIKNRQLIPNPAKGAGFSFDLYYQLITKEKHKLQVSVMDLGYINWKNNAIAYNYDTLFRFEGIQIPNLFELNDSLVRLSQDSIVNRAQKSNNKSFKTILPAWLQLSYSHQLIPQKLALNAIVRYRFNDIYLPFLAVGATYFYNSNTHAIFHVGYGGYGNFNYALMINQRIGKQFTVGFGSNQLEGWLMPQKANGQSVVFSVKSWF
jgi:hypothetical protein